MRNVIPLNAKLVPENAKKVFTGVIYDVYHWQLKMYDGSLATFEMLKRPDSVMTIAVVDGQIVVLRQLQPDSPKQFYGLPGGRHDHPQESELEAAKRETQEETGMLFSKWKLLDAYQPHGKIEQFVYTFLATDLTETTAQSLDSGEKIEVELMDLSQVRQLLKDPAARYLPKDIFTNIHSIDDLMKLPEYKGRITNNI